MSSTSDHGNISQICQKRASLDTEFFRAEPNIPGVIGIFVFYGAILAVGVIATCVGRYEWKKSGKNVSERDHVMLADRKLGVGVGIFTMAGTIMGGGFINGTTEYVFTPGFGLAWVQGPFFYQVSTWIASLFAVKMKKMGHRTLLDPFEIRFGQIQTAFTFLILLLSDVLWAGTNLAALGTSLSVIIGVNYIWAVLLSAAVATLYTVLGGLYSVAYTDVIQLILIFCGLWLTVPFAWLNEAVTDITVTARSETSWIGRLEGLSISVYIDIVLLIVLGGMPWQEFFMRALALKVKSKGIVMMAFLATSITFTVVIPCVLLGGIAASTDWNMTGYRDFGEIPVPSCDYPLALPMVMRFLTPVPVGVIGLAALCAGVMSSTDSAILSSSSMFANNVYTPLRNAVSRCCSPNSKASDREIVWVMRFGVFLIGAAATIVAINAKSIYGLYVLCSDLGYVSVFPQFLCAVFIPFTNIWGAVLGFWVAVLLRLLSGEQSFDLPTVIKYPYFDESTQTQMFPFRTLIAIIHLIVILGISAIARAVFGADNKKYLTTYAVNQMTQADRSTNIEQGSVLDQMADRSTSMEQDSDSVQDQMADRSTNMEQDSDSVQDQMADRSTNMEQDSDSVQDQMADRSTNMEQDSDSVQDQMADRSTNMEQDSDSVQDQMADRSTNMEQDSDSVQDQMADRSTNMEQDSDSVQDQMADRSTNMEQDSVQDQENLNQEFMYGDKIVHTNKAYDGYKHEENGVVLQHIRQLD